jgi:hypothetical protein
MHLSRIEIGGRCVQLDRLICFKHARAMCIASAQITLHLETPNMRL